MSFGDFSATIDPTKTKIADPKVVDVADQSITCAVVPEHAMYSPDGSLHAAATETGVIVRSLKAEEAETPVSLFLPRQKIVKMAFSPLGTYLVTWERQTVKDAQNLFIWKVKNPEVRVTTPEAPSVPVASFLRKIDAAHKVSWPLLAWSSDEHFCARMCAECIEILPGAVTSKSAQLMRIPARTVDYMEWCPVPERSSGEYRFRYLLAVFCLPRGSAEAGFVGIYDIDPERYPAGSKKAVLPISERKFMQADSCVLNWNPAAGRGQPQALLATVCTDSDATGTTYYGTSELYILFADKPHLNGLVPCRKKGNIHDVAWSPDGKMFAVVYGYMPSMTSVFEMMPNGRSVLRGELGPLARNVVKFSPDSRIIFIGGFGNLSGDMDFFDAKDFSVIGRANAHTTTQWEWSPDGAFLSCGVTAPRRHMDNGFHIFSVNGQLVLSKYVPEMYDFQWEPCESMTRAVLQKPVPRPLPPPDREARITLPQSSSSPATAAPTTVAQEKYVPPHLRAAAAAAAASGPAKKEAPKTVSMQVYDRYGAVQPRNQQPPGGQQQASKPKSKKNKKRADTSMQMARREY